MGRPYSLDLRQQVIAAVDREGMSRQAGAHRYGIAPSTAINWVRQFCNSATIVTFSNALQRRRALRSGQISDFQFLSVTTTTLLGGHNN
jgi:putative transposase